MIPAIPASAERAATVKWLRSLDENELADAIERGQHMVPHEVAIPKDRVIWANRPLTEDEARDMLGRR